MPLLNPSTVHEPLAPVTVQVKPPGLEVTVYEVGVMVGGAVTTTVALPFPAVAVGLPGVSAAEVVKLRLAP